MKKVTKFYADWCGPCRVYGPTFDKVAKKFEGQVLAVSLNIDGEGERLASEFEVRSIPATVLEKEDGSIIKKVGLLSEDELTELFLS